MHTTDNEWLNLHDCKRGTEEMPYCWEANIIFYWGKNARGGEQRGACGNAPESGLIFPLFLPYHWLDQAWWMMEGARGGWGVDRTCSQSCPSLQNVRKTRDCCVRRAAEEEGKVDAPGQRRRGGCVLGVETAKGVYRRFCWWHLTNTYVPLFSCLLRNEATQNGLTGTNGFIIYVTRYRKTDARRLYSGWQATKKSSAQRYWAVNMNYIKVSMKLCLYSVMDSTWCVW